MTIKELFAPSDMTVGKPWEKIVAFTIPMLIGNIAQQLYNTVDSIVIGKYVGDNALAAVGSASPILNLLLVLFVGISVGAGVMVSQYFGAKQRKELSMTIGNCVTLTAISSIIIMILGAVLSRPLLEMLKTPDSIIDWCTSYLVILMVGCAGSAYYNILCGILRGLGADLSAGGNGHQYCIGYCIRFPVPHGRCRSCIRDRDCAGNFCSTLHVASDAYDRHF